MYAAPTQWGKFNYEEYAKEYQETEANYNDSDDYGFDEHESFAKVAN